MTSFDPEAYGAECAKLLRGDRLCELGPGTAVGEAGGALSSLNAAALFGGRPIADQ